MCLAYGTFDRVGVKLQVFSGPIVTKWRVLIPIYVVFASCANVNLYTTLDFQAAVVLDF